MFKKAIAMLLVIAILAFVAGFLASKYLLPPKIGGSTEQTQVSSAKTQPPAYTASTQTNNDPIQEQIDNMSLEEKIGQMVMVGFDGSTADQNVKRLIADDHVGGIIFFKDNFTDPNQMLSLVNQLKELNSTNKEPLFLSVDQEGGRVNRMPDSISSIPASGTIGKYNNKNFSFNIGSLLAQEVKMFGLNMNFAPVLDINSNPKNPVIGDRAFGSTPSVVRNLGIQTMKGIQSQNIISVVKHFPGHGDTSTDSHIGLPIVNNDLNRLESFELLPFEDAVKNGVDAVMVAHILLPKIDSDNPASLSKNIITGILRDKMKFNGVVFTDDMTMGAIADNYGMGEAAVKSINAGSDIVLVCHEYDKENQVIQSIKAATASGEISEQRINQSVYRILKLKAKYKLNDKPVDKVDITGINKKIKSVLDKYMVK
ncbi:MAG: beta-N-acetylhexosaminidase [Bacillota bacterium]|nr:beta-N-acetylhexosaminidase [Bacillota bacterium]